MILSLQALETSQLPNTTADLLDQGDPANIAIISPDGPVLTYGSLKCQVESLANQLNSFGIGRGDRVAIVLPNGVENIVNIDSEYVDSHLKDIAQDQDLSRYIL